MNKKKISIGVIGIGRIGKIHLKNLFNHFKSIKIEAISEENVGTTLSVFLPVEKQDNIDVNKQASSTFTKFVN